MNKHRQLTNKRAKLVFDISGSRHYPLPVNKTTIIVYNSGKKVDNRTKEASKQLAKLIAPIMAKSQTSYAKNKIIKTTREFWVDFYCLHTDLEIPQHLKKYIVED